LPNNNNNNGKPNGSSASTVDKPEMLRNEIGLKNVRQSSMPATDEIYNISLLDMINKKIISLLEGDTFLSQTEIAKKLGLSQSSIALRLDKLRKSGILSETVGIRLEGSGLEMCRVDLACSDAQFVIQWAKSCPLFVNGSSSVGGRNVSLYFISEDVRMFQNIVDEHVRRLEGVSDVHFFPIVTWATDYIVPVKLDVQKSIEPPCHLNPYCPRCPANKNYDGKIWANRNRE
jgi:DNA-binding Lrp family transcriptional regulator